MLPSGRQGQFLSAQNALLAPSTKIDLRDISEAGKFVDSTYARVHSEELDFLQPNRLNLPDFLETHLLVIEGAQVFSTALDRHVKTLDWLSDEFPNSLRTYAVAVDGNGTFCTADNLYDHNDPTFMAAFHHQPGKFLHPKLQHLTWNNTIKAVTNAHVFLECTLGIQEQAARIQEQVAAVAKKPGQASATPIDNSGLEAVIERANTVHDFLLWETPEMRSVYEDPTWSQMVDIAFVPAQCPPGNGFRATTMRSLLPPNRLISLSDGIADSYMAICWSQKPFFLEEPSPNVLLRTPGFGRPTPQTIIDHLRFLSDNAKNIEYEEIPQNVADVRECYRYLQIYGEPVSVPADNCAIWFNTDQQVVATPEEFICSWVSTQNLCLGLEYDSGQLKQVRSFLKPFIELLMRCGVREVTGPRALPVFQRVATEYPCRILSQLQQFRKEGLFIDLKVIVQGTTLGVHRVVLGTASEYFKRMFSSGMRESLEDTIFIEEMTVETATRIFDYIYTGEMTPVTPSEDPTDEMEQLLGLLEGSNRFELLELKSEVEGALCHSRYMRPESVNAILRDATEWDAQTLKTVCEDYIARNRDIIERIEREEFAEATDI
ncbi:hypothetical protein K440DRAFT_627982 [Wilcoxina mikolae CBS 423.85]|nr:hypothetical protein K440DRAFT_627982 [Wilcoxina mikolae CBS 423.85]